MTDEPDESRVEVLLKEERRGNRTVFEARTFRAGGPPPGAMPSDGRGRWLAFAFLGLLYLVMISVFLQSFEPRSEWVNEAGRTMLEDRPVFWPLIVFALLGRMLSGLAAWYPSFSDPTMGLFKVPDSPPLQKRRLLFRVLYGTGLAMAFVTLVNNLAFSDILGIFQAVGLALLILFGITLLFRLAMMSFLSRLSVNLQRRR